MIRPAMPWEPAEGRKAVWYEVFDPAGRRLGMFFGLDDVDLWVVGKPGVRWRVLHWRGGVIEGRYDVEARAKRVGWRRRKRWRVRWTKVAARKGGA